MGNRDYGIEAPSQDWSYINKSSKRKRRSFKKWLRDYINQEDDLNFISSEPSIVAGSHVGFNKSFEGWNIRLHRANDGHIIEAWKNVDGPTQHGYRPDHELFMVRDDEDLGAKINDILVQLMLRG